MSNRHVQQQQQEQEEESEAKRDALNYLSLRRAAAVAAASTSATIANNPGISMADYVRLSRQRIELEVNIFGAEHAFIDKMFLAMHYNEQVDTLFHLIDVDENGTVDALELAEGLRKMNDMHAISEVLPLAEKAISNYARAGTHLTPKEFENFIQRLCESMQCTFGELAQLMVAKIVFSETGRSLLEDAVSVLATKDASIEAFDSAVVEARLILVFDMFDDTNSGTISHKEVVKHLFRFTESMDSDQRAILLMVDEKSDRMLDFCSFTELVLHVGACFKRIVQLHEIADAMTLSACRQDVSEEDIRALFCNLDDYHSDILDRAGEEVKIKEIDLSSGKLIRLFDLWDLDHNGLLDLTECTLGMQKFHQVQEIRDALEHTKEIVAACDVDENNQLDRSEFALLLSRFAKASDVDLHRLVDFMVVQSALKDSDEKEEMYLQSYRGLQRSELNTKLLESKKGSFAGLLARSVTM